MKKIAYFVLSMSILSAVACKSNDAASDKIDFTQSYESAALTLTNAQTNFTNALATNDSAKINQARKELQTATTNYVASKNSLIQHGGTVKQEYESNLTKSEQVLSTPIPAVATSTTPADSTVGGKVGQTINKTSQSAQNAVHGTLDKASETVKDLSDKKAQAQQNIQTSKDNLQKNAQDAQDKAKKLKDDVNNLFK